MLRIRTDDEVYRVDAVWLGPPKATFPFRARYVAWGVDFLVLLRLDLRRRHRSGTAISRLLLPVVAPIGRFTAHDIGHCAVVSSPPHGRLHAVSTAVTLEGECWPSRPAGHRWSGPVAGWTSNSRVGTQGNRNVFYSVRLIQRS